MRRSCLTCVCEELECFLFRRNQAKLLGFASSLTVILAGMYLGDTLLSFGLWACCVQCGYYFFISLIQIPSCSTWIPNSLVEEQIKNMLFTFQMVVSAAAVMLYCALIVPNTVFNKIIIDWKFSCDGNSQCMTTAAMAGSAALHFFPIHAALIESVVSYKKYSFQQHYGEAVLLTLFCVAYTVVNVIEYFITGTWKYVFENVFPNITTLGSGLIIHGIVLLVVALAYFCAKWTWIWIAPLSDPHEEKKDTNGRFEKWEMKRLSRRRTHNTGVAGVPVDLGRDSDASVLTMPRKTSFGLDKLPPEALLAR